MLSRGLHPVVTGQAVVVRGVRARKAGSSIAFTETRRAYVQQPVRTQALPGRNVIALRTVRGALLLPAVGRTMRTHGAGGERGRCQRRNKALGPSVSWRARTVDRFSHEYGPVSERFYENTTCRRGHLTRVLGSPLAASRLCTLRVLAARNSDPTTPNSKPHRGEKTRWWLRGGGERRGEACALHPGYSPSGTLPHVFVRGKYVHTRLLNRPLGSWSGSQHEALATVNLRDGPHEQVGIMTRRTSSSFCSKFQRSRVVAGRP
ncbi:hypothetical protein FKP32DRAFT_1419088 [Trametes sanguinea]|nr:hypothetical protein FKP32DRAFT_1419088 [Trametes sanguinea]